MNPKSTSRIPSLAVLGAAQPSSARSRPPSAGTGGGATPSNLGSSASLRLGAGGEAESPQARPGAVAARGASATQRRASSGEGSTSTTASLTPTAAAQIPRPKTTSHATVPGHASPAPPQGPSPTPGAVPSSSSLRRSFIPSPGSMATAAAATPTSQPPLGAPGSSHASLRVLAPSSASRTPHSLSRQPSSGSLRGATSDTATCDNGSLPTAPQSPYTWSHPNSTTSHGGPHPLGFHALGAGGGGGHPAGSHWASPAPSILNGPSRHLSTLQLGLAPPPADGDGAAGAGGGEGSKVSCISVAVRLRPLSDKERVRGDHEAWSIDAQGNMCVWVSSKEQGGGKWVPKFHYDNVFGPQARNRDVYEALARPLVAPALQGVSGSVFAYGVTSSGKTHTMMGSAPLADGAAVAAAVGNSSPGVPEPGLVPLVVHELFTLIASAQQQQQAAGVPGATGGVICSSYTVRLSMMEIYNEVLNDLLDPSNTNLKLREDTHRGVVAVENLKEELITSAAQALACISRGDMYRKVSATAFNEDSSRSHTICRLLVEGVHRSADADGASSSLRTTVATLSLIDLAGSESAKVSMSRGQRIEGSFINKSLLTLGTVINKLAAAGPLLVARSGGGQQPAHAAAHIPFRDSKLTRLLQNSMLGSGARIAIVCNITPAAAQSEETANTLKFAARAKLVRVAVSAQQSVDTHALLRQYRHELRELRAQVAALLATQQQRRRLPPMQDLVGGPKQEPQQQQGGGGASASAMEVELLRTQLNSTVQMLEVERAARQKAELRSEQLEDRLHGLTRALGLHTSTSSSHGGGDVRHVTFTQHGALAAKGPVVLGDGANATPAGSLPPSCPGRGAASTPLPPVPPTPGARGYDLLRTMGATHGGDASDYGGGNGSSALGTSTPLASAPPPPPLTHSNSSSSSSASAPPHTLLPAAAPCPPPHHPHHHHHHQRVPDPEWPGPEVSASQLAAGSGRGESLLGAVGSQPRALRLLGIHEGGGAATGLLQPESRADSLLDAQGQGSLEEVCSPGSDFASEGSDADLSLIEQIDGLQDELLGSVTAGLPPTSSRGSGGVGPGRGVVGDLQWRRGPLLTSPEFQQQVPHMRSDVALSHQHSQHPQHARQHMPGSLGGSTLGDGDKDLEIQVLLADREVLQDQVLSVELENERLAVANELLTSEAERLRIEHEKVRRINKELESDMVAMREFRNELVHEADTLKAELSHLRLAQQQQQLAGAAAPGVDPTVWLSPGNLGQDLYEAAGVRELQEMLRGGAGGGAAAAGAGGAVASRILALEAKVQTVLVGLVQRNQQLEARLAQQQTQR